MDVGFRAEIACSPRRRTTNVLALTALGTGFLFLLISCEKGPVAPSVPQDVYTISIDPVLRDAPHFQPQTGRLLIYFITEQDPRWSMRMPLRGPFLENPQPIASIAVDQWDASQPIELTDATATLFLGPLDGLTGTVRVQASLHTCDDRPRLIPGPCCYYSDTVTLDAHSDEADRINITLDRSIPDVWDDPTIALLVTNLHMVELPSALLNKTSDSNTMMRAAVVLPPDYDRHPDVTWPAIYIIPDRLEIFEDVAVDWARTMQTPGIFDFAPHAVHIVLDPGTAYGHHGFVDSEFHGRRATALVAELIPHLEKQFRLKPAKEARILSGTGLGAWSALWLQLHYPDTFGACWASAPTPIDFNAFQTVALYSEDSRNAFHDDTARPAYAYRTTGMRIDEMIPSMTVEQMSRMERAIDPAERSGGLYDVLNGMYSPVDPVTGRPKRVFDPCTGAIDSDVLEQWRNFDITLVALDDWPRYGPIFRDRVHLSCADLDSYYFDAAVRRFASAVQELPDGETIAQQAIHIVEGATHENLQRMIFDDWNEEMLAYLIDAGLLVEWKRPENGE